MGSVLRQQICDQLWQSQLAPITLVQCAQMVGSSVWDAMYMGSVMCQQIWDQFGQSQLTVVTLVQCVQMVGSSVLD